jgi:CheY-like chemotaxis protein
MEGTGRRILVVEDNPLVLRLLDRRLKQEGYSVATASGSTSAIRLVYNFKPELMVLDLSLIDDDPFTSLLDGLALLSWLRRTIPTLEIPVILHTVEDSPTLEQSARAAGVYAVCRKVGTLDHLVTTIRQAFGHSAAA